MGLTGRLQVSCMERKIPLLPLMDPMVPTSQTPGMDALVRSDPRSPVNADVGLVTGPGSDSLAIGGHSGWLLF